MMRVSNKTKHAAGDHEVGTMTKSMTMTYDDDDATVCVYDGCFAVSESIAPITVNWQVLGAKRMSHMGDLKLWSRIRFHY